MRFREAARDRGGVAEGDRPRHGLRDPVEVVLAEHARVHVLELEGLERVLRALHDRSRTAFMAARV